MLIVYTLIFQLYDWFSSYCGIIFIRAGGGQCSLVAKICLVHGNVIFVGSKFGIILINIKQMLYVRLLGCKFVGKGFQRKPQTLVPHE